MVQSPSPPHGGVSVSRDVSALLRNLCWGPTADVVEALPEPPGGEERQWRPQRGSCIIGQKQPRAWAAGRGFAHGFISSVSVCYLCFFSWAGTHMWPSWAAVAQSMTSGVIRRSNNTPPMSQALTCWNIAARGGVHGSRLSTCHVTSALSRQKVKKKKNRPLI